MKLHLLHTNDLHGHLENWPVIQAFIQEQQNQFTQAGEQVITIDIGDAMDAQHPLVEASVGQVMVDLFNQADYDLATIGNNEGLNFTPDQLAARYQEADFQLVISNLLLAETDQVPKWGQSVYYQPVASGKVVAFIGLTAPYPSYHLNHYIIQEPLYALRQAVDQIELREDVIGIVLLSHLGIQMDRQIAQEFPQIQVILGGHTHHLLVEGEWVNESLLAACGRYGDFVGHVTMNYDWVTGRWDLQARAYDTVQLREEFAIPDSAGQVYLNQGRQALADRRIAYSSQAYYALDLEGDHSFIQLALEAVDQTLDCDLVFLNSGLFLSDLPQGWISENDLHEALPHPMHLATVRLKGSEFIEFLESIDQQAEDLKDTLISGLGFRGKVFGEIVFKGLDYHPVIDQWSIGGQLIQKDQTYRLGTVDHLTFLSFFPVLTRRGEANLLFPDFLRHVVAHYLRQIN
ncbi:bifunctional metallophosphatase/5'-nucleotidase [Hutsoniella sourekii]